MLERLWSFTRGRASEDSRFSHPYWKCLLCSQCWHLVHHTHIPEEQYLLGSLHWYWCAMCYVPSYGLNAKWNRKSHYCHWESSAITSVPHPTPDLPHLWQHTCALCLGLCKLVVVLLPGGLWLLVSFLFVWVVLFQSEVTHSSCSCGSDDRLQKPEKYSQYPFPYSASLGMAVCNTLSAHHQSKVEAEP